MLYSYTKQLLTKYKNRYHQRFIKTLIQFDTCNVSCLTLRELIHIHLSFHPSIHPSFHPSIHTYTWTYLPPDLQPFKLCDTRSLRIESKLKYKGTEWYRKKWWSNMWQYLILTNTYTRRQAWTCTDSVSTELRVLNSVLILVIQKLVLNLLLSWLFYLIEM